MTENTVKTGAEFEVFINGESFIENRILEDYTNLMLNFVEMSSDILATNSNATGINFQTTIHHRDSSRFASTIDTEEGEETAFINLQINLANGFSFTEAFLEVFDFNDCLLGH